MKTKISEVDGYSVWAELRPIPVPAGYFDLKITSVWTTAKDPEAEQVKFHTVLSPAAAQNYYELFSSVITK